MKSLGKEIKKEIVLGLIVTIIAQIVINTISYTMKMLLELEVNFLVLIVLNLMEYLIILVTTLITIHKTQDCIKYMKVKKFKKNLKYILEKNLVEWCYLDVLKLETIYEDKCMFRDVDDNILRYAKDILRELNISFTVEEAHINPYSEFPDAIEMKLDVDNDLKNILFVELKAIREDAPPF